MTGLAMPNSLNKKDKNDFLCHELSFKSHIISLLFKELPFRNFAPRTTTHCLKQFIALSHVSRFITCIISLKTCSQKKYVVSQDSGFPWNFLDYGIWHFAILLYTISKVVIAANEWPTILLGVCRMKFRSTNMLNEERTWFSVMGKRSPNRIRSHKMYSRTTKPFVVRSKMFANVRS